MSVYAQYVKQNPNMQTEDLANLILAQEKLSVEKSTVKRAIRRYRNKLDITGSGRRGDNYTLEDGQYIFDFDGYVWDMPLEEVAAICRWYPDPHGLTKDEVCTRLRNFFERDITPDFLDRVLRCIGLTKKSNPLAPHILDEWDEEQISDYYLQIKREKVELANVGKEASQWKKLYEEQVKLDLQTEAFLSRLAESVQNDPPEFQKRKIDSSLESTSVVLMLSDWHVGKTVNLPTNKFNKDIFQDRIALLIQEIEEHFRSNTRPIDEFHVVILGDMVDGPMGNMHDGQWVGQDLHHTEQVAWCAKALAYVLDAVSAILEVKISVHSVGGNHGRVSANRKDDELRFADQMMYVLAKEMTCADVDWHREDEVVGQFMIYDTKILLTHGERIGKEKDLAWIHRANSNHFVVCTGHLHAPRWELTDNDVYLARGGSACGTDEFATRYGKGCRPAQVMFEVRKNGPRNFIDLPMLDVF